MTEHVVITGSSGYVGQHLISFFCSNDDNALINSKKKYIVTAAYGALASFGEVALPPTPPHVVDVRRVGAVDLSSAESVRDLFETANAVAPVTAVVHCAALTSPAACERDPERARAVNRPTSTLLPRVPSSCRRFVFLSTDQVYEGRNRDAPYAETDPTSAAVNVYGRTKAGFETDLAEWSESTATAVVVLRSSLVLGPPAPLGPCRKASFLQFVHERALARRPTTYYEDEIRSVVHVRDVVETIVHFIVVSDDNNDREDSGVFNMGGPRPVSRVGVAEAVARRCGFDAASSIIPVRRYTNNDDDDDGKAIDTTPGCPSPPNISMNVDKLRRVTGRATTDLERIVEEVFPPGAPPQK